MKTKMLLLLTLFLNLTFGQSTINQSVGNVQGFFSSPVGLAPQFGSEIFRFRSGLVTQLDSGTGFGFTSSRWFSLGRLNTGTQTVYGLRFQLPNKAVTFGYQDVNSPNPRIQWIGTGASLGNLEFRVANSFTSTSSTLVASMTPDGNTIFGDPSIAGNNAQVSIESDALAGLVIQSNSATQLFGTGFFVDTKSGTDDNRSGSINTQNALSNTGINLRTLSGKFNIGVQSFALESTIDAIGVQGITFGDSPFEAGIFGQSPQTTGSQFAGFFDGDVFIASGSGPSDIKLKENITSVRNFFKKSA
jgi:hypothetical protein